MKVKLRARHGKPLRVEYRTVRLAASWFTGVLFGLTVFLALTKAGYSSKASFLAFFMSTVVCSYLLTSTWERARKVSGEERRRGYRASTGKR